MRREAGRENRVSYLKRGRDVQKQGRGTTEKKKSQHGAERRRGFIGVAKIRSGEE